MPADLVNLVQLFGSTVDQLLVDCNAAGWTMVPFYARRRPEEQARLWRQSRSSVEVRTGIEWLRGAGAVYLAGVVEGVGPQHGRWATNAVPGNSWHQWDEAVDCYALVDDRISWDTVPGRQGGPGDAYYRFYATDATRLGLHPLGPTLGDWVHVQARPEGAPAHVVTWPEIDAEMRRRYGS